MRLSERIKQLRENKNMSVEELAAATGSVVGAIKSYESGEYRPSVKKLALLAIVLEADYDELYDLLSQEKD